ncbi:11054_t:CDS:2 [Gigaspora margarita]|uniref:11054_t:CDS:1 n=1 Tax=Gigaspora margarita TaxID=4874 RepID=A0ABN7UMS9_GIGMA|nr:11054_t:CDS:2 [Gigaspora margarita]
MPLIKKASWRGITDNLELLPDSSDLIPEHITEFLFFVLPIAEHKNTREVVAVLRKIYSFPHLPSSYFYDNKSPMPNDLEVLVDTLQNLFSITEFNSYPSYREIKGSTSSYSTRIGTKSTLTIPIGPNASLPRLLKHGGHVTEKIQLQTSTK